MCELINNSAGLIEESRLFAFYTFSKINAFFHYVCLDHYHDYVLVFVNHIPAKLVYLNFHPLKVGGCGENYSFQ